MFGFQIDVIDDEVKDDLRVQPKEADDKTMDNS